MNTFPPLPVSLPALTIPKVPGAVLLVVALADFLLWGHAPGLSLALFTLALGAVPLLARGAAAWSRVSAGAAVLLLGAVVQMAIEISFSNLLVATLVLLVLHGEVHFAAAAPPIYRWLETQLAMLRSPARWWWLWHEAQGSSEVRDQLAKLKPGRIQQVIQVLLPAIGAGLFFAFLLAGGNAVFRDWAGALIEWLFDWNFSFGRWFFWLAIATLAIAWVSPSQPKGARRIWSFAIDRWNRADRTVAVWQSALLLAVVNGLFFVANTADAIHLWGHRALPAGVTYSGFVHNGVYGLTLAVLFAAVVLVVLFQQNEQVVSARAVRPLALVWIVQNLVVLAGVVTRLKLYVEAYQLSLLRVYVVCFLVLVAVGFCLLARYVWGGKRLGWLVLGNAAATFLLFYTIQFADVAEQVARWNIRTAQARANSGLDVQYMRSLGPSAWKTLSELADSDPRYASVRADLWEEAGRQSAYLQKQNWRSRQVRRDRAASRLVRTARP